MPTDSELKAYIDSVQEAERLISLAISALAIFAMVAVGIYVISSLVRLWQSSLNESRLNRARTAHAPRPADAWSASADRLATEPRRE